MFIIFQIVSILFMIILVAFIFASNGTFIAIVAQNVCFRKVKNILMCSLALSNILMICVVLITVCLKAGFGFSNVNTYVCVFTSSGIWLFLWINFSTCFLLSFEQYMSIIVPIWHHIHMKSQGTGIKIVAYAWLLSLIGWILYHLITNPIDAWLLQPNSSVGCEAKLGYLLISLVVLVILVTFFVGYVNCYMMYVGGRINKGSSNSAPTALERNYGTYVDSHVMKKERFKKASRNFRRFILIYISFIVVHFPVVVLVMIEEMFPNLIFEHIEKIRFGFIMLQSIKLGLDPLLFSYKDVKLRKAFKSYMLCGICRK